MKRIDPTALYEGKELQDLLRGVVNVDTLRQHGLVGSPGRGYWGQNVIDALNDYWQYLARQRGAGKVRKEVHLDREDHSLFENGEELLQSQRRLHPAPRRSRPVESQRERFERQVSKTPVRGERQG